MAVSVFISYSHKDEELRDQLDVQLTILKRQGLIEVWHDRKLNAGDHVDEKINEEMEKADIVLILVSPDFLASDYCYSVEMKRAMQRHREGSAKLIAVILRSCDWKQTDLGDYLVAPMDGIPIRLWRDVDEAFLDVTRSIRKSIESLGQTDATSQAEDFVATLPQQVVSAYHPKSSNQRNQREFTQPEIDDYLHDVIEYLERFFITSLQKLEVQMPEVKTKYNRIDGLQFTATIYRDGISVSSCTVTIGRKENELTYYGSEYCLDNAPIKFLTVDKNSQHLSLKPFSLPTPGISEDNGSLSHEGAAEYFWSIFIEPLQE